MNTISTTYPMIYTTYMHGAMDMLNAIRKIAHTPIENRVIQEDIITIIDKYDAASILDSCTCSHDYKPVNINGKIEFYQCDKCGKIKREI